MLEKKLRMVFIYEQNFCQIVETKQKYYQLKNILGQIRLITSSVLKFQAKEDEEEEGNRSANGIKFGLVNFYPWMNEQNIKKKKRQNSLREMEKPVGRKKNDFHI